MRGNRAIRSSGGDDRGRSWVGRELSQKERYRVDRKRMREKEREVE